MHTEKFFYFSFIKYGDWLHDLCRTRFIHDDTPSTLAHYEYVGDVMVYIYHINNITNYFPWSIIISMTHSCITHSKIIYLFLVYHSITIKLYLLNFLFNTFKYVVYRVNITYFDLFYCLLFFIGSITGDASLVLFLLTLLVTPANIYMLTHGAALPPAAVEPVPMAGNIIL